MSKLINIFYLSKKKLDKNIFLQAIKQSFLVLFPLLFIGALSLLLQSFPVESVRLWINNAFDGAIIKFLTLVYYVTFGLASLYLVFTASYKYYIVLSKRKNTIVFACINALMCYFILLGPKVFITGEAKLLDYTDMTNIFTALISSIFSTYLYYSFLEIVIKITKHKFSSSFKNGLHSVIPMFFCFTIFSIISLLLYQVAEQRNFNDLIIDILSSVFKTIGNTFIGGFLIICFSSMFWLVGIHGNSVFENVYRTVYNFEEGKILTKYFFDCFSTIGGSGATIGLVFAIILFSKNHRKKKTAILSSVTTVFNINETLIYGIPILFNPIYAIPFVLAPLINYSVAYLFVCTGVVAPIVNSGYQWTTPFIISGYVATQSVGGLILQLVCVVMSVIVYCPFVLIDNKVSNISVKEMNGELEDYIKNCEKEYLQPKLFDLNNYLSNYAEDILLKVEGDIYQNNIELHYQPQVRDGKIIGVEALLRMKYRNDKYLYPPLVVDIVKEKNLFMDLSKAIVIKALNDYQKMLEVNQDIELSVNLDLDLLLDEKFVGWFIKTILDYKVPFKKFGFEITENSKFFKSNYLDNVFSLLNKKGINIYMDDFSMGHTAIIFLQHNHFDYVKLDGSLVKDMDNPRSNEIINSIIKLGKSLGFKVVAEYVETEEQSDKLLNMGCDIYQGFLYYQPLDIDNLIEVLKKDGNNE